MSQTKPLLVVALGGNALLKRGEPLEAATQLANVRRAAGHLARLAARFRLVVTHGNGPQVGLLALQNAAYTPVQPYPLDVLDAQSEGMIGYLLEQEIANRLPHGDNAATLLTRIEVNRGDSAFDAPSKPIGPMYSMAQCEALRAAHPQWRFMPDGTGFRRAVASPQPQRILNLQAVQALLERGMVVICAGGGIPVAADADGRMEGVEAVIDKDLASSLLACQLHADQLLIATDVSAVYLDWGLPSQRPVHRAGPAELRQLPLAAGSMAPKVEAACRFAEIAGKPAVIGCLDDVERIERREAGTWVVSAGLELAKP